jgi:hypothetical protein
LLMADRFSCDLVPPLVGRKQLLHRQKLETVPRDDDSPW